MTVTWATRRAWTSPGWDAQFTLPYSGVLKMPAPLLRHLAFDTGTIVVCDPEYSGRPERAGSPFPVGYLASAGRGWTAGVTFVERVERDTFLPNQYRGSDPGGSTFLSGGQRCARHQTFGGGEVWQFAEPASARSRLWPALMSSMRLAADSVRLDESDADVFTHISAEQFWEAVLATAVLSLFRPERQETERALLALGYPQVARLVTATSPLIAARPEPGGSAAR